MCLCPDNTGPSLECCETHGWTSAAQITFPASHALAQRWDVGQEVISDICDWCSQMLPPPQSMHLFLCRWCSHRPLPPQRAGALRGFLAAEGCGVRALGWHNALAGRDSSFFQSCPCGPAGPFRILFLPTAAASRTSM